MAKKEINEYSINELEGQKKTIKAIMTVLLVLIILFVFYFLYVIIWGSWQTNNLAIFVSLAVLIGVLSTNAAQVSKINEELKKIKSF